MMSRNCVWGALYLAPCSTLFLLGSCAGTSRQTAAKPTDGPSVKSAAGVLPARAFALKLGGPWKSPVGLAWDGANFLVSDSDARRIFKLDPTSGITVESTGWPGEQLGAIAMEGASLWGVDEGLRQILRIEPASGQVTRRLDIPRAALHRPPAITGLAWDGRALWLVTACGLCSTLYRIDPVTGAVTQRVYPMCAPRGLAFDGTYLWTVAYNGPDWPPRLSRRRIGDATSDVVSSHRLLDFVAVRGGPFPRDPTGISAVGASLWVLDRATRQIFEVAADRGEGAPAVPQLQRAVH